MPALNNISVETVCEENRRLLEDFQSHELINGEGFIDLNSLDLGQQKQIIKEIIKNEESNVIATKENYRKSKYKAKNISEVLTIILALFVAQLTLAPFFIASSIILPVLPILFFGVAIIAITNLFLNRKINQLRTNAEDADKVFKLVKVLNQLTEPNEVNVDDSKISNDFNKEIQEVKNETKAINNKIDVLAANTTRSLSQLLVKQGTFSKTIPPMPDDPVNESHNKESTLNITHN